MIFSVNQPDFGKWGHDEEAKMIDVGVADPTYGQFSQTAATKGVTLDQLIFDRVSGSRPAERRSRTWINWSRTGVPRVATPSATNSRRRSPAKSCRPGGPPGSRPATKRTGWA